MKKFVGYLTLILINYLVITLIVFAFSISSLKNGKVYDWLWIKYIQTNIYFMTGFRNVFQSSTNDCVKFDEDLIYVPKKGVCKFSNPEFTTELNFDETRRLNMIDDYIESDEKIIAVVGDSIAMGWGVKNDETFSYNLQKLSGKKVINLGVSSYGTIREIKRLKKSKYYNQIDTIIIQYHINDYGENIKLNSNKKFTKKDFNENYYSNTNNSNSIKMLLRLYKKSLRLLFSHANDLLFPNKNVENWGIDEDLDQLKKIISGSFIGEKKKIIVFTTLEPWQNFEYDKLKKFDNFDFMEVKFKKKHKFIVDDHPNKLGHEFIAKKLYENFKF